MSSLPEGAPYTVKSTGVECWRVKAPVKLGDRFAHDGREYDVTEVLNHYSKRFGSTLVLASSTTIVERTIAYAKRWEVYGFKPTRMACRRYIEIFEAVDEETARAIDERWNWIMRELPQGGGSIELRELLWQGMLHCYRWGKSLGVEGCSDITLVLIPRKQGKTDTAARQGLATLHFSRSKAPKVYSIARTKDQGGISFDYAAEMLEGSDLDVGTTRDAGWFAGKGETSGIQRRENRGRWTVLPGNQKKKLDGLQADLVLIDEGALVDDDIGNVLISGMSDTVEDQHLLSISTAGSEPNWFTRAVFDTVDRIEAGESSDYNILVWAVPETVHNESDPEFDPEKDIGDPETWRKTNPCLGITITEDRIEKDWRRAKASPSYWIEFCRTRINMFTSKDVSSLCSYAVQKQVSNSKWDELVEEKLRLFPASLGIDISSSGDPTSVCVSAMDDENILWFKTQNFICRQSYEFRMERFRANILEHLVNAGQLVICGHEKLDYEVITQFVAGWAETYGAPWVYSDTATGGMHFRTLMVGDLGIPILDFGKMEGVPGTQNQLRNQTKNFFIDSLHSGMLRCPESDCYRWELNNAAVKIFPDDRKDIVKLAGRDALTALTIDGVYATLHSMFPFTIGAAAIRETMPAADAEEWADWGVSP